MDRTKIIFGSRRQFIKQSALLGLGLAVVTNLRAGAQKEEYLAAQVALAMSSFVQSSNPPRLVFSTPVAGKKWLRSMDTRLAGFVDSAYERQNILINTDYEASRAGLDPQLLLGLMEVESRFRRYAISAAGARGLMQVMPFWVKLIGAPDHDLFDIRVNLRYGCAILRHYLDQENGRLDRALGRYNGSLGVNVYPDAVLGATRRHWYYSGEL